MNLETMSIQSPLGKDFSRVHYILENRELWKTY